jgi:predicted AAA+ superfamily ATPase
MERIYDTLLKEHFRDENKMAFVVGPRQVGKTTASQTALPDAFYLNWDNPEHRALVLKGPAAIVTAAGGETLRKSKPAIIFDEIHKFARWKSYLKGFYDTYGHRINICVTGSARLNVYKHGGDSLMGRYFIYRMHPFSVREIRSNIIKDEPTIAPGRVGAAALQNLITFGGFPEPFLRHDTRFFNRWKRLRADQLFREDLRDLSRIGDINALRVLSEIIVRSTGGTLNYSHIANDLQVSVDTVRRWIDMLESVYFCFRIRPYSKKIARSLLKEPKAYPVDWSAIGDPGKRYECMVASHLRKFAEYCADTGLADCELYYVRDKAKREVDFLLTRDKKPWMLVEVKTGDAAISESLRYFKKATDAPHAFQLSFKAPYVDADCFTHSDPIKVPALTFLSQLA